VPEVRLVAVKPCANRPSELRALLSLWFLQGLQVGDSLIDAQRLMLGKVETMHCDGSITQAWETAMASNSSKMSTTGGIK
jgi:hypothetical protein